MSKFSIPFLSKSPLNNNKGEIVSIPYPNGSNQKGGSIPGMFAIPMGIYNRVSDAKKEFNQRQIQQQKIKLKKQGFNSLEDKISS